MLIIVCLFALSLSEKDMFIPMNKESKYGEDVCKYRDDDGYYHVRSCEKGKYCATLDPSGQTSYLEICLDIPQIKTLSNLKDNKCSTTFECEGGLNCDGSSCRACDPVTSSTFDQGEYPSYSCRPDLTTQGSGYCESTTIDITDYHQITKYSSPDKYKKCGKLTIEEYPGASNSGQYYIKLNEYDYIGTVKDGEYVTDMELCESGFALYFYYGGKYKNPKPSFPNKMYLRCVTPLAIHKINTGKTCSINYKINDDDSLNYNVDQLDDDPSHTTEYAYYTKMKKLCDEPYIKIMSERFREFSKSITEQERETCGDLDGINKYTCENNELIKSWFSYKNPETYLHYNDRKNLEKVFGYLIQKEYPSYSLSQFLSLSFLYLLMFILI
jgi:hypothetical protein